MLKHTHLLTALAASAAIALTPAVANAQAGPFPTLGVSVKLAHTGVREPGKLALTVKVSACAGDVDASAVSETTGAVKWSTLARQDGHTFTLSFSFTTHDPAGTWVVGDVFGRPCATTRAGSIAFDPTGGYFPSFRVVQATSRG